MTRKNLALIWKIVLCLALGIVILNLPIPYYQDFVACKPGQQNCRGPGWYLGPALYQYLKLFPSQSNRSSLTPSPIINRMYSDPEDTVFWKIYTNKKNKFSIRYPDTYTITETGQKGIVFERNDRILSFRFEPLVKKNEQDGYLDIANTMIEGISTHPQITEGTMNNYDTVEFSYPCKEGFCRNILVGDMKIQVLSSDEQLQTINKASIDQILSTFQITSE